MFLLVQNSIESFAEFSAILSLYSHFSQNLFIARSSSSLFRALVGRIKIQAKIQIREMPLAEGVSSRAGLLKRGHSVVAGAR